MISTEIIGGEDLPRKFMLDKAEAMGKPFAECESVEEWLERWFIPLPIIDGEPFGIGQKYIDQYGKVDFAEELSIDKRGFWCVDGDSIDNLTPIRSETIEDIANELFEFLNVPESYHAVLVEFLKRANRVDE